MQQTQTGRTVIAVVPCDVFAASLCRESAGALGSLPPKFVCTKISSLNAVNLNFTFELAFLKIKSKPYLLTVNNNFDSQIS